MSHYYQCSNCDEFFEYCNCSESPQNISEILKDELNIIKENLIPRHKDELKVLRKRMKEIEKILMSNKKRNKRIKD